MVIRASHIQEFSGWARTGSEGRNRDAVCQIVILAKIKRTHIRLIYWLHSNTILNHLAYIKMYQIQGDFGEYRGNLIGYSKRCVLFGIQNFPVFFQYVYQFGRYIVFEHYQCSKTKDEMHSVRIRGNGYLHGYKDSSKTL